MGRKISFEQAGNIHRSVKQIFAYDAVGDATFIKEVWVYDADGNPQQVHPQLLQYPVGLAQSQNEAYDPLLSRILVQGTMTAAVGTFFTGWSKSSFLGSMTDDTFTALGTNWTIWDLWSDNATNRIVMEIEADFGYSGTPTPSQVFRQFWIPGDNGSTLVLSSSPETGMTYTWSSINRDLRMEWPTAFKFVPGAYTYSMRRF